MSDPYDLQRFVHAQAPVYARVLDELRSGHKTSHWMWFVFPQLKGLGHSSMARTYGIASIEEAQAYLAHPVLGPRLEECSRLLLAWRERPISSILGSPDDLKLRSSMTLFSRAAGAEGLFDEVLQAYFDGNPDEVTLSRLNRQT